MDTEEYTKILQLVRSDDVTNRVLAFQLAKGQGYDLVELFCKLIHPIGTLYKCTFGTGINQYYIICSRNLYTMDWIFTITINSIIDDKCELNDDCTTVLWNETKKEYINKFINLILE